MKNRWVQRFPLHEYGATISGINDIADNPLPSKPATQMWTAIHYRYSDNKFFVQPELMLN